VLYILCCCAYVCFLLYFHLLPPPFPLLYLYSQLPCLHESQKGKPIYHRFERSEFQGTYFNETLKFLLFEAEMVEVLARERRDIVIMAQQPELFIVPHISRVRKKKPRLVQFERRFPFYVDGTPMGYRWMVVTLSEDVPEGPNLRLLCRSQRDYVNWRKRLEFQRYTGLTI